MQKSTSLSVQQTGERHDKYKEEKFQEESAKVSDDGNVRSHHISTTHYYIPAKSEIYKIVMSAICDKFQLLAYKREG